MDIVAVTTMRNEGPHCLEWIAHHLAIGVTHFLIYSNDCDDGTDTMLDVLASAGIVTHERLGARGKKSVQWQALKHATDHTRVTSADWVWVADCDEFINLRAPLNTLSDLIAALPNGTEALAMPWRLFGHSGHIEMQDQLTIERFTHAAPADIALPLAHFCKSLFRPAGFRQLGVHRPKRRKGHVPVWADCDGNLLAEDFAKKDQRINLFGIPTRSNLVQLNHYSLRAAENFMLKRQRGLPNHMQRDIGLGYWCERNFNTVPDSSIARMVAAMQQQLDRLLAIGGLASLHAKAFETHKSGFETLMQDRDNVQLFWQLCLSAGSTPPSRDLARTQIDRIVKCGANG